jgi:hypothetical protein
MGRPQTVKDLVRLARAQGWSVEMGSGHWKFVPPDKSKSVVHVAATPSDWRTLKNTVGMLRRAGLDV